MESKYFWLKLCEGFFDREEIKLVRKMAHGDKYITFYLQLLLKSLNTNGELIFRGLTAYTPEMLATVTDTDLDIVNKAIDIFTRLHLMGKNDNNVLFMTETDSMTGGETKWAKRKREYRDKKQVDTIEDGQCPQNVPKMSPKCPTELELDKELDKDIYIDDSLSAEADKQRPISDFYRKVPQIYINTLPMCPRVINPAKLNERRRKLIKARLDDFPTMSHWVLYFEWVKLSPFLTGKTCGSVDRKPFLASFDWLLKPVNITKITEGNFHDDGNFEDFCKQYLKKEEDDNEAMS